MKYVVFAHYDEQNKIDDYVLYYLKELKKICEYIIFVSDGNLEDFEKKRIKGLANECIFKRHGEYDFGSYKRGFFEIKEKLRENDQLIFVNDSCFGPIYPLKPIFESMEEKSCDMWSICSEDWHGMISRQSWFIVFSSKIFFDDDFIEFMSKIKKENTKEDIIRKYEIGLMQLLEKKRYKLESIWYYQKDGHKEIWNKILSENPDWIFRFLGKKIVNKERYDSLYFEGGAVLLYEGLPFIKKQSIIQQNNLFAIKWKDFLPKEYPAELIENYLKRYQIKNLSLRHVFLQNIKEKISRFVFYKKVSARGYLIVKVFKVPIIHRKIY